MKAKFSIIVPIYKIKEAYLRKCIESIINQTYKEIEIILIDDGSPDNCGEICDEYKRLDDRIIVHHCENGGLSNARNLGLMSSVAPYVIFVDGDDWIETSFCEKVNNVLENQNPDVIIMGYNYSYVNGIIPTSVGHKKHDMNYLDSLELEKYMKVAFLLHPYLDFSTSKDASVSVTMWAKVYKRQFLLKNKLKCIQGISPFEDNIFFAQMLLCNPKMYFLDDELYYYRINSSSITQKKMLYEREKNNLIKTIRAFDKILENNFEFKYLLGICTLMRIREILEKILNDKTISYFKKKNLAKDLISSDILNDQLQEIQRNKWIKKLIKKHKIFYWLVKYQCWYILLILFKVKNFAKREKNNEFILYQ